MTNPLLTISPIDGRYREYTQELSNYFSEYAYLKFRIEVEIKYLFALSKINVIRKLKSTEQKILIDIFEGFNLGEASKLKTIEVKTKHDVKAIEYYIKQKIQKTSLSDISDFVHFGLTSEDINNLAIRLMLKSGDEDVISRNLDALSKELLSQSKKYRHITMLARTHGQAALPTTLGKEILVFYERLENEIKTLTNLKFRGKLNGAVGNYNALLFTFPKINWLKFSKDFVRSLGLNWHRTTTQIAPYEDLISYFQTIQRINGIILDLNQDIWRYISDGWLIQAVKQKEVGSSTMPQKINPILFENSEGNLVLANSLISGFVDKLPVSRLQRDLSGSTISRNFGAALAYSLLAYKNCLDGLLIIKPNLEKISDDLNSDWSILSEAVQVYLKKNRVKNGYEIVKSYVRGQKMTKELFLEMLDKLPLSSPQKEDLKKLSPQNYIGII